MATHRFSIDSVRNPFAWWRPQGGRWNAPIDRSTRRLPDALPVSVVTVGELRAGVLSTV